MAEKIPETSSETTDPRPAGEVSAVSAVEDWFVREVLPLEAMLMHFLHQNWRNKADLEDFRQEIYAQLLQAAETALPERTRPFVFATARNLLINRVRREQIVPIDAVADMDSFALASDEPGPDRNVIARDTLRKLHLALDRLPPRAREAVVMRRIEGLSRSEIAQRMGITERTVAEHIANGMRILANTLFGETPKGDA
ncbi:MAG TPA: sigma-70 family RNA polymerase sigma factor [Rhizomicrobium sp.]|nr:sigma-70 family RNA polymerase sigma factor [Rhizomicrobium sp.]